MEQAIIVIILYLWGASDSPNGSRTAHACRLRPALGHHRRPPVTASRKAERARHTGLIAQRIATNSSPDILKAERLWRNLFLSKWPGIYNRWRGNLNVVSSNGQQPQAPNELVTRLSCRLPGVRLRRRVLEVLGLRDVVP
jgi:hypothetical protein